MQAFLILIQQPHFFFFFCWAYVAARSAFASSLMAPAAPLNELGMATESAPYMLCLLPFSPSCLNASITPDPVSAEVSTTGWFPLDLAQV